ncbi:hypothetical protein Clacol_000100 [Clathrus columnatus]|uniref:Uncharacterized protein n=1 Tax=Clathrus columnatus TaxID=1419009 RepID=A0AAV4ZXV2_9AGAM|nr:hypothetical protein Clacol_000100 [Clathrus columnatus]
MYATRPKFTGSTALRRRNMKNPTPNLSDIHLPTLSLLSQDGPAQMPRSVLGRLHESLVAEMTELERPDPVSHPNSGEVDIDDLQISSTDSEMTPNNAI